MSQTYERLVDHENRIENLEKKLLKYRVLLEMSDVVEKAQKEYSELLIFAERHSYPFEKCDNIVKLFTVLDELRGDTNKKVFRTMAAIEKEFFPNSYKKKLEEEEKNKPEVFGTRLAKEIMEEIRRKLREESK